MLENIFKFFSALKLSAKINKSILNNILAIGIAALFSCLFVSESYAAPAKILVATVNKADTLWIIIASILVLIMALPGLALFYGGLVRAKNLLSIIMQVSAVTAIGMITYCFWGYSLSFTNGGALNNIIGGFSRFFLNGVNISSTVETFTPNVLIPEYAFFAFQMTFACVTAAVVLGGIAERIKFTAVCMFAILWPLLSYYPLSHMTWFWAGATTAAGKAAAQLSGTAGLFFGNGVLDFAGGLPVEANSGVSALIGALIVGSRFGYKNEPTMPHSLAFASVGAGLLWFGWFGFNAGSNLEAGPGAALTMVNTFLATAAAGISWSVAEYLISKKSSTLGFLSGIIAGLVAVTPASGYIGPIGAIFLGLLVSPICIYFVAKVKHKLKYDDSLDAFGIHGIGGMFGTIATGVLASPRFGGTGITDYTKCANDVCQMVDYNIMHQLFVQFMAVLFTTFWAATSSAIVFFIIKYTIGLRADDDAQEEGLDISEHGERAYHV